MLQSLLVATQFGIVMIKMLKQLQYRTPKDYQKIVIYVAIQCPSSSI
jgi:hypothetical protein